MNQQQLDRRHAISRRGVRLGSGLDARKLADTISQIASIDEKPSALICDAADNPDAWVHLMPRLRVEEDGLSFCGWILTLGYPLSHPPVRGFAEAGVTLPAGARTVGWESGIYARLDLPIEIAGQDLAAFIELVMLRVQGITTPADVEVALETISL